MTLSFLSYMCPVSLLTDLFNSNNFHLLSNSTTQLHGHPLVLILTWNLHSAFKILRLHLLLSGTKLLSSFLFETTSITALSSFLH